MTGAHDGEGGIVLETETLEPVGVANGSLKLCYEFHGYLFYIPTSCSQL